MQNNSQKITKNLIKTNFGSNQVLNTLSIIKPELVLENTDRKMFEITSNNQQLEDRSEDDHIDVCCCVCSDNKCITNNFLVYCIGCNVVVHIGCYGIINVNENDNWFCRRCEFKQKNEDKHDDEIVFYNICY